MLRLTRISGTRLPFITFRCFSAQSGIGGDDPSSPGKERLDVTPPSSATPPPPPASSPSAVAKYLLKFNGTQAPPPPPSGKHILLSGITALAGFSCLAVPVYCLESLDNLYLIGPFGSSAALLFGAPDAPFSQPRNCVGGHIVSAAVGVTVMKIASLLSLGVWFSAPVAVAGSIVAMQATRMFHPPAAGTGLLAVVGSPVLHALGYSFVIMPVGVGALTMVVSAVLINNLIPSRQYPKHWL